MKRTLILILMLAAMVFPAALAQNRMTYSVVSPDNGHIALGLAIRTLNVLGTFMQAPAHPDDETFSVGATLARYADQGVELSLITASRGEAGELGSAPVEKKNLAAWRERELREATDILGVKHLHLLRLPDGHLEGYGDQLRTRIAEILRREQPQVVITEDVQGVTGHPDHMAVTRAAVDAFDVARDAGVLKLYEQVIPLSRVPGRSDITGAPDDYVTTTLELEPWRERHLAALAAHRSQVPDELLRMFRGFPAPWRHFFICVRTRVPILIPENDLFAGVSA